MYQQFFLAHHQHTQLTYNRWLKGIVYGSTAPRRGIKDVIKALPLAFVKWDTDEEGSDISSWTYTTTEAEYARRGFFGGTLAASAEW